MWHVCNHPLLLPLDSSRLPKPSKPVLIQPRLSVAMLKCLSSTSVSVLLFPTCEMWSSPCIVRCVEDWGPFVAPSWFRVKPSVFTPNGTQADVSSVPVAVALPWLVAKIGSTAATIRSGSFCPLPQFCHRGMVSLLATSSTCSNQRCSEFPSFIPPQSGWGVAQLLGSAFVFS